MITTQHPLKITWSRALKIVSTAFLCCVSCAAADGSPINRLVYSARVPGEFCWLEKGNLTDSAVAAILNGGACPLASKWNSLTDFFNSGSVVQLYVTHGKFRSVFTLTVNGTEIQPALPQIRGIADAQPAAAPGATAPASKSGGSEVSELTDAQVKALTAPLGDPEAQVRAYLDQMKNLFGATSSSVKQANRTTTQLLGAAPTTPQTLPGFTILSVKDFADRLNQAANAAGNGIDSAHPFSDRAAFDGLTNRTDQLVEAVRGLNQRLTGAKLADTEKAAISDAEKYKATAATVEKNLATLKAANGGKVFAAEAELRGYLNGGTSYGEIATGEQVLNAASDAVPAGTDAINADLMEIFNSVNGLYENSDTTSPFEVLVGQWAKNTVVKFDLREVPGFNHYGFGTTADAQIEQPPQQAGGVTVHPPAGNNGNGDGNYASNKNAQGAGQPKNSASSAKDQSATAPQGTLLETGVFNVHQFFRANVVSGFFASSLYNRDYGVKQIPVTGSSTTQSVATVGAATRPQIHYFVGLNYYLKERDLFPGSLKRSDYFTPGVFFGYGLDDQLNFLVGPNWETKWGINLGFGAHIGRETFLASGITPGVTPLSSTATSPPTTTKPKLGAYFSVGFDLSVFKSVFGQITGSGTSAGTSKSK